MKYFWTFPSANPWQPYGDGSGWGFHDTITLAVIHKPIAISESGAGQDGSGTGPADDPAFPEWLGAELHRAEGVGLTLAYVNIWDTWMSDGDWAFPMPSDGKPFEAAAWVRKFGRAAQ